MFLLLQMYVAVAARLEENAAYVYKEEEDVKHIVETWGAARKRVRGPLYSDGHPLQRLRDILRLLETPEERLDFTHKYLTELLYASDLAPLDPMRMFAGIWWIAQYSMFICCTAPAHVGDLCEKWCFHCIESKTATMNSCCGVVLQSWSDTHQGSINSTCLVYTECDVIVPASLPQQRLVRVRCKTWGVLQAWVLQKWHLWKASSLGLVKMTRRALRHFARNFHPSVLPFVAEDFGRCRLCAQADSDEGRRPECIPIWSISSPRPLLHRRETSLLQTVFCMMHWRIVKHECKSVEQLS